MRFHVSRPSPCPENHLDAGANLRMLERLIKLALWSRGGHRIRLDAPSALVEQLRAHYRDSPTGRFDSEIVGHSVYGHPIEIEAAHELPPERSATSALGGHLDGCRIGFDLGGSDRKVAAIIDGHVVWSEETEWDPYHQPDPQYHWDGIMDSLRRAADHLPRVDAIGGSAAGVYVDNQVKFASLFRGVDVFGERAQHLPRSQTRLARHPFDVASDATSRLMDRPRWAGGGSSGSRSAQHRRRIRHRRGTHDAVAQRDRLRAGGLPRRRPP